MKPFVNKNCLLKKIPGKGGWTYCEVPEIKPDSKTPFGWVRVRGSIDGYEISQYKLMPMGDGQLFLPVKAAIRKAIGKGEGDTVKVILFPDDSPVEIPDEILECFAEAPAVCYKNFLAFKDSEKKVYLDWIYAAKREETKIMRILKMMERVERNLKFYDKLDRD